MKECTLHSLQKHKLFSFHINLAILAQFTNITPRKGASFSALYKPFTYVYNDEYTTFQLQYIHTIDYKWCNCTHYRNHAGKQHCKSDHPPNTTRKKAKLTTKRLEDREFVL